MRFGICTDPENAALLKKLGYDYIELPLAVVAAMDEFQYEACVESLEKAGLKSEAMNVMLPGTLRLTGISADHVTAFRYLEGAFVRAAELGAQVVVFGSGAARKVPEGFPIKAAWQQLVAFAQQAGELAKPHGISLVVEPLNPGETNIINTVAEGAVFAKQSGIFLLADLYHVALQQEGWEAIAQAGSTLRHIHVANPADRVYPAIGDGMDYKPFLSALKSAGYDDRISIEGGSLDLPSDARRAKVWLDTIV